MAATVMELYGSKVFNEHEMRERLPSSTYKSLKATIEKGQALDLEVANVVASVMKRWAIEQGGLDKMRRTAPAGLRRKTCYCPVHAQVS